MGFICFTLISNMENNQKTIYLLFFCTLSYYLTTKYHPFSLYRLNVLEQQSNLAILLTVFSGSLNVLGVNDFVKTSFFSLILIANFRFFMIWFFAVAKIFINLHGKKLHKYFPRWMNFMAIWQKTSNMMHENFNLIKYCMEFYRRFQKNSELYSLRIIKSK